MTFTDLIETTPPLPTPAERRIAQLELRMASLERVLAAGGEDRKMTVQDFAARIHRSPKTVRNWLGDPASRHRMRLAGLFVFDGGRLLTTESRFRKWADLILAKGELR